MVLENFRHSCSPTGRLFIMYCQINICLTTATNYRELVRGAPNQLAFGRFHVRFCFFAIFIFAATLHVIMFFFGLFVCLFFCPIQIMEIQDLPKLNKTNLYSTKTNKS